MAKAKSQSRKAAAKPSAIVSQDLPTCFALISRLSMNSYLADFINRHSLVPRKGKGKKGAYRFCQRLLATAELPDNVTLLTLHYMEKVSRISPSLLQEHEGQLIFTACLLLASRFIEDSPYAVSSLANMTSYGSLRINRMARIVCEAIDYQLYINHSNFTDYESQVLSSIELSFLEPSKAKPRRSARSALPTPPLTPGPY
ncbi:hypothetical protein DSO57_1038800 [Entomophthora muscae]|uniref:Uncharacterized protein n=1 Tax=Entomophthora muscae TaxID=34485 RepID=A0ACC2S0Q2_9FUNG|nr:hypothetical protein DSO57_1038800 [Entomophthora muscae]